MVDNFRNKNLKLGIIFMIVSTLGFSFMQIFVKLTSGKFTLMQQVFMRNFVMLIICATYILIRGSSFLGEKRNRKLLLMRSTFGYMGVIFNFYAINHMVVADAGILQRTSPIFVVLIACFLFKEKFTLERFLTLTFIAYMCVSKIGKAEKTETIIFLFSLFSTICSFPFIFNNLSIPDLKMFIYLILIGVASAVGQFGLTISYQYANASDVSIFNYLGIVFVVILGKVILNESVSMYSLIGIALIFSMSLMSYIVNSRKNIEKKR